MDGICLGSCALSARVHFCMLHQKEPKFSQHEPAADFTITRGGVPDMGPLLFICGLFLPLTAPAAPRCVIAAKTFHKAILSSVVIPSVLQACTTLVHKADNICFSSDCEVKEENHIDVTYIYPDLLLVYTGLKQRITQW